MFYKEFLEAYETVIRGGEKVRRKKRKKRRKRALTRAQRMALLQARKGKKKKMKQSLKKWRKSMRIRKAAGLEDHVEGIQGDHYPEYELNEGLRSAVWSLFAHGIIPFYGTYRSYIQAKNKMGDEAAIKAAIVSAIPEVVTFHGASATQAIVRAVKDFNLDSESNWKKASKAAAKKPANWKNVVLSFFDDVDYQDFDLQDDIEYIEPPDLDEALRESIDLYWEYGRSLDDIKRHLYEDRGLEPIDILKTLHRLGGAIQQFDSDASSEYIKLQMLG